MPDVKPLLEGHKANFETLKQAFENGDVALVSSKDKQTGEDVALLCAVALDGTAYQLTPFAVMVNDNPFERYEDPAS